MRNVVSLLRPLRMINTLLLAILIVLTVILVDVAYLGGYFLFGFYLWFLAVLLVLEIALLVVHRKNLKSYFIENKMLVSSLIAGIYVILLLGVIYPVNLFELLSD